MRVLAVCPCSASLELARDGVQTGTVKQLLVFLEVHRPCRGKSDLVIKTVEA